MLGDLLLMLASGVYFGSYLRGGDCCDRGEQRDLAINVYCLLIGLLALWIKVLEQ